jgi:phosphoribosylglycinamide formyltransferase-1
LPAIIRIDKESVGVSSANLNQHSSHPAKVPLVILASGQGSIAKALIEATQRANYPAEVKALISDKPGSGALQVASECGVEVLVVPQQLDQSRDDWCQVLADSVQRFQPEWVVCAGFMRILSGDFLQRFPGRVINTHPSLLPQFPGAHAVADALAAGVTSTGVSVHFIDEGIDTGPVIAQEVVPVLPGDDLSSLYERIKQTERRQLVDVVAKLVGE